jgi:hypothetical protein
MNSGQVLELVQWHLFRSNAQFVEKLPLGRPSDANVVRALLHLVPFVQRVRAASVRPVPRERNLFICSLLKQQPVLAVKQENGEGTVQQIPTGDVGHQMGVLFGVCAHDFVVFVHQDAHFLHKCRLDRVVGRQVDGSFFRDGHCVFMGREFEKTTSAVETRAGSLKLLCAFFLCDSAQLLGLPVRL